MTEKSKVLDWARRIQGISQNELEYANSEYDVERGNKLAAIAAEMLSENSNLEYEETLKIFLDQKGYATPRLDVRTAIIREGKILLVKESSDGKWAMPGGWADVGDMPAEAAIREAKEESGFDVKIKKVVGIYDSNRSAGPVELFQAVKLVFLCEIVDGEATPSFETPEVKFFDFSELPELSYERTNIRHINHIKEHLEDETKLTYYE